MTNYKQPWWAAPFLAAHALACVTALVLLAIEGAKAIA
jgi:hypothetical protein